MRDALSCFRGFCVPPPQKNATSNRKRFKILTFFLKKKKGIGEGVLSDQLTPSFLPFLSSFERSGAFRWRKAARGLEGIIPFQPCSRERKLGWRRTEHDPTSQQRRSGALLALCSVLSSANPTRLHRTSAEPCLGERVPAAPCQPTTSGSVMGEEGPCKRRPDLPGGRPASPGARRSCRRLPAPKGLLRSPTPRALGLRCWRPAGSSSIPGGSAACAPAPSGRQGSSGAPALASDIPFGKEASLSTL